jgi:hypothetical protein
MTSKNQNVDNHSDDDDNDNDNNNNIEEYQYPTEDEEDDNDYYENEPNYENLGNDYIEIDKIPPQITTTTTTTTTTITPSQLLYQHTIPNNNVYQLTPQQLDEHIRNIDIPFLLPVIHTYIIPCLLSSIGYQKDIAEIVAFAILAANNLDAQSLITKIPQLSFTDRTLLFLNAVRHPKEEDVMQQLTMHCAHCVNSTPTSNDQPISWVTNPVCCHTCHLQCCLDAIHQYENQGLPLMKCLEPDCTCLLLIPNLHLGFNHCSSPVVASTARGYYLLTNKNKPLNVLLENGMLNNVLFSLDNRIHLRLCPKCRKNVFILPQSNITRRNTDVCCSQCDIELCMKCGKMDGHAPLPCSMMDIFDHAVSTRRGNILPKLLPLSSFQSTTMQSCPNCSSMIEKEGGCSYMLCVCGYQFCWLCRSQYEIGHEKQCYYQRHMNTVPYQTCALDDKNNSAEEETTTINSNNNITIDATVEKYLRYEVSCKACVTNAQLCSGDDFGRDTWTFMKMLDILLPRLWIFYYFLSSSDTSAEYDILQRIESLEKNKIQLLQQMTQYSLSYLAKINKQNSTSQFVGHSSQSIIWKCIRDVKQLTIHILQLVKMICETKRLWVQGWNVTLQTLQTHDNDYVVDEQMKTQIEIWKDAYDCKLSDKMEMYMG